MPRSVHGKGSSGRLLRRCSDVDGRWRGTLGGTGPVRIVYSPASEAFSATTGGPVDDRRTGSRVSGTPFTVAHPGRREREPPSSSCLGDVVDTLSVDATFSLQRARHGCSRTRSKPKRRRSGCGSMPLRPWRPAYRSTERAPRFAFGAQAARSTRQGGTGVHGPVGAVDCQRNGKSKSIDSNPAPSRRDCMGGGSIDVSRLGDWSGPFVRSGCRKVPVRARRRRHGSIDWRDFAVSQGTGICNGDRRTRHRAQ